MSSMIDGMWLLLTFGPLLWMVLIAAVFGWHGEDPAWVRALVLYCKALCLTVGIVAICLPWVGSLSTM
jgi:hypothetical protein